LDGCSRAWDEYRSRGNLFAFAFLGYVPVVGLFALATIALFHTTTPAFALAIAWMAFFLVASIRLQLFKCPRCGNRFFVKSWFRNDLARRCLHCKLKKYAGPETDG
jgi:DNA-directed RNA polymerase subunit RPC12/RpoP